MVVLVDHCIIIHCHKYEMLYKSVGFANKCSPCPGYSFWSILIKICFISPGIFSSPGRSPGRAIVLPPALASSGSALAKC